MTILEKLIEDVQETLPTVVVNMDRPIAPEGRWFVDFRYHKRDVVLEWDARGERFGVTLNTSDVGYGERSAWVTTHYYRAFARILGLLAYGT